MKYVNYFFYTILLSFIHGAYSQDFFHLEHLPQGTKIPVLKLVNLIPAVKNTPIQNAQLEDLYVQAVVETPAIPAHLELLGKIKLNASLPGLQNIGDLDLSLIGKIFSGGAKGGAPVSATQQSPRPQQQSAAQAAREQGIESTIARGNILEQQAALKLTQESEQLLTELAKPGLSDESIEKMEKRAAELREMQRKILYGEQLEDLDRPIESVVEEEMKPTSPGLIQQEKLSQEYSTAIKALEKLPQTETTKALLTQLRNEQTMITKLPVLPESTPNLRAAQRIILGASLPAQATTGTPLTQSQLDNIKVRFQTAIDTLTKQQQTTRHVETKQLLDRHIKALTGELAYVNAAQTITDRDVRNLQMLPKAEQFIIDFKKEYTSITPPPSEARNKLNQKYQQTIDALNEIVKNDPTQKNIVEKRINALKTEQELFSHAPVPPETTPTINEAQKYIRKAQTSVQTTQPKQLTPDQVVSTRTQINDMIGKLRTLPQTEFVRGLINELNFELGQLNRIGTPPSSDEFPGIAKAAQFLAAPEKVPFKEKVAVAGERVKEKITALPGKVQAEYEALRAKVRKGYDSLTLAVNQASKDLFKVGGALFIVTLQNPDYKPFQNVHIPDLPPVDIPGIKDIELNNAELGIFAAPPQMFSLWAQGTGRVINIPLLAKVFFNYEPKNTGIVLQAGLPETWKVSDSFPEMKSFDRLDIKRAYVYVSTIHYVDFTIPTKTIPGATSVMTAGRPTVGVLPGITIRPGLSLYGEINLRKLVPEVFDHINFVGLETASMYGTISLNPANWVLGIGLPDLIKIENSPFKSAGTWIEISASVPGVTGGVLEPYVSFVIAMTVQPSPKDEVLTFTARILAGVQEAIVAFSMQGFWNNAMGVEGLSIGDLAIQLHTGYKNLLAGIPISGFGFTGTFKFGTLADSPIIKIASLYAMTKGQPDMALQGKIDGTAKLGIFNIIDGCKSLAINAAQKTKKPVKEIDEAFNKILNNPVAKQLLTLDVRNAEFKIADKTVRIGEFFILQGFTLKGELTLLGVTAGMDFNLGQSGLTATGYLSPIKIGDVFSLTGAGMDKQYGTPDDGATMSLALNFLKQHFIITGQVKLLGIEQQTDIFIDTEGLNCTINGKIFNLFDASVQLKSRGDITNPDLYFKASMKQEFTKYIVDETIKALRASTQESVNKIKDAQNEVDKLNNNIADLDKQIADRKKQIDELSKVAAQAPKTSPEIAKLGLELTGLGDARFATIASRDAAQKILEGSQDAINKFNAAQQEVNKLNASIADFENQISTRKKRIDELGKNFLEGLKNAPEITKLGIEITGLETAKAGTIAARNTATGVLSGLSGTASLISTNQGQIDNLNKELARIDQQIAERKKRIDELSKQFVQGAQTTPEITRLGLELTGLETAKAGAIASRETAKVTLEGVRRWVGGASIIAEAFIQHAAVPLDIRESTLEASVQDIAKGKLPRFTATAAILGKKLNLDMQLDFSSPEKARESANDIAQQILALFK